MSTITKERAELKAFITGFLSDPAHDNQSSRSLTAEVFRTALASLEAEAVLPAPVSVPDEVLKMLLPDAEKAEFWFEHDGKILFEGVKFNNAVFEACRAAMLQGADGTITNEGTIPANTPCKLRDAVETIRNSGIEIDAEKILAERDALNSPAIPDGWVACSERMPEPRRWLAMYGSRVFTHGPEIGKPYEDPCVDQGYLGSDGRFYFICWESPGMLDDNYENDLAMATHWMYWELPAAPPQE